MDTAVLKVLIFLDLLLSSRSQISNSTFFREGTKVERRCLCDLCRHKFEEQCFDCDCCKNDLNRHVHVGEFNNTYDENLTDLWGTLSHANYSQTHWYKNQTRTLDITSKLGNVSHFEDDQDAANYLLGGNKASCRVIKLTPKILINTSEAPFNYLELHFQPEKEKKMKRRITGIDSIDKDSFDSLLNDYLDKLRISISIFFIIFLFLDSRYFFIFLFISRCRI